MKIKTISGFTLLEAIVALGLVALMSTTILGLLLRSQQNIYDNYFQFIALTQLNNALSQYVINQFDWASWNEINQDSLPYGTGLFNNINVAVLWQSVQPVWRCDLQKVAHQSCLSLNFN